MNNLSLRAFFLFKLLILGVFLLTFCNLFCRSNYHNLSNSAGDNIDSGVPLDYEIDLGDLDFTKLYYFNFEEYF